MLKFFVCILVLSGACAELDKPVTSAAKPPVRRELVLGTKAEQAIAAQQFCGDESWSLEPLRKNGLDDSEAYAVCSGFN